ncbi:MAG: PA2779 family protein [Formivibrio sp.]|nr:PA2779 family protein [Formivibrio sp.]
MKINTSLSRRLIAILVVAMSVQAPLAQAEIVSTDEMAVQNTVEQDRAKIQNFIERANVKERLLAMGVSGVLAEDRVASLSEQEVHALAQKIDSLPAGGNLSNTDLIIILLVVILVAVII